MSLRMKKPLERCLSGKHKYAKQPDKLPQTSPLVLASNTCSNRHPIFAYRTITFGSTTLVKSVALGWSSPKTYSGIIIYLLINYYQKWYFIFNTTSKIWEGETWWKFSFQNFYWNQRGVYKACNTGELITSH